MLISPAPAATDPAARITAAAGLAAAAPATVSTIASYCQLLLAAGCGYRFLATGRWLLTHSYRLMAHGSWLSACDCWLLLPGAQLLAHFCWLPALGFGFGSWFLVLCPWFLAAGFPLPVPVADY